MIPVNFAYCRPCTPEEAVQAYEGYEKAGKKTWYYGGGSEIISMARVGSITPEAVVDLKEIPACCELKEEGGHIHMGGALSLRAIADSQCFPLLGKAVGRIADHTNQCRITLGGNLCGTIIYREAVLPLLLAEAQVSLQGPSGVRRLPLQEVFDGRMQLLPGEFILKVHVPKEYASMPYFHVKKAPTEKIDYPAVSLAAIIEKGRLRIAFAGICSYPFRSKEMEEALNDAGMTIEQRLNKAVELLPEEPADDAHCSRGYRQLLFENMVGQALMELNKASEAGAGA
ncbi:MAG: FAD binding domain-containing protein [Clostridiales bacterium]